MTAQPDLHVVNQRAVAQQGRPVTLKLPTVGYRQMSYTSLETGVTHYQPDRCSCGKTLEEGDVIRYRWSKPMHADCYVRDMDRLAVPAAWLAIAEDMQRAPSKYNSATTRAVLENLCRMVEHHLDGGDL